MGSKLVVVFIILLEACQTFCHLENSKLQQKVLKLPNFEVLPDIFICIPVPEKPLFLEEFFLSFKNQDYPKKKFYLYVTAQNQRQVKWIKSQISDKNYK